MTNIAVFASGSGTNFQAIIDATENGRLPAKVVGLIASKPEIGAIQRAQNHKIPVAVLSVKSLGSEQEFANRLLEQLLAWNSEFIVLAGYLNKVPEKILDRYPESVINIHPSLLPKYGGKGFYGMHVHRAVLEAGDSQSGCTVHFVNHVYDDGEIIAQKVVPVLSGDTPESLQSRVLEQEHVLLINSIKKVIEEREPKSN